MESWMLASSEKASFGISNGVFPPSDSTPVTKEALSDWGMGNPCNPNNSIAHIRQGVIENSVFLESNICRVPETIPDGSVRRLIEYTSNEHGEISSSSTVMKADEGEKEEGSRESSSIVDPDAQESSLIDLKLGRLSEWRDSEYSKSSRNFSTDKSIDPSKRARSAGMNMKAPICQVHGCNMDLSSFKNYYKRHKVCQVHSKTAKVAVNGIERRFCQQCSRFHLLSEFDDGKRSCRKRLAGHNERRRKTQTVFQPGNSSNLLGTSLCQDGIPLNGNCETINWSRSSGLNASSTSMQVQTSAFYPGTKSVASRGLEKEISYANGNATVSGSAYSRYASQYSSGVPASNSTFDVEDSTRDFAGVPYSGRARSLLSSQPANIGAYPSTIPVARLLNLTEDEDSLKTS